MGRWILMYIWRENFFLPKSINRGRSEAAKSSLYCISLIPSGLFSTVLCCFLTFFFQTCWKWTQTWVINWFWFKNIFHPIICYQRATVSSWKEPILCISSVSGAIFHWSRPFLIFFFQSLYKWTLAWVSYESWLKKIFCHKLCHQRAPKRSWNWLL